MTTWAKPGVDFEASSEGAGTGLVGSIGVRISNPATQVDVVARTTSGITEYPASSGIYSVTLTAPTTPGTYQVIWDSAGVFVFDDLLVSSSNPASLPSDLDLCSVADVVLAADVPDSSRDDIIQACVTAASIAIADRYQREFAEVGTATRRFAVTSCLVELAPRDLQSVDSIILDPDGDAVTLAASDYKLLPRQSILGTYYKLRLRSGLTLSSTTVTDFGSAEIDITGTWGAAAIPPDVARAATLTAASWVDRAASAYGIDSDGVPGGVAPDFASTWSIPLAAHMLCKPYQRMVA